MLSRGFTEGLVWGGEGFLEEARISSPPVSGAWRGRGGPYFWTPAARPEPFQGVLVPKKPQALITYSLRCLTLPLGCLAAGGRED